MWTRCTRYQEMVGFGAAVTDSSAWNIATRLNADQRETLLRELFGRDGGLGLSFTRISIGASDFSLRHYSLDDPPGGRPDPDLAHFSIDPNRAHLLPVLRAALAINPDLRIVASPWSPPGWMKSSGSMVGGRLLPEFYPAFAAYLTRFVDAYAAEGVPIFALTIQNEPNFVPDDYPGMKLTPKSARRIVGKFLGPRLTQRPAPPQILEWDHNWDLPSQPLDVLADPVASRFIAGVAWHCYNGDVSAQRPVHNAHPDKDAYMTECSGGEWDTELGRDRCAGSWIDSSSAQRAAGRAASCSGTWRSMSITVRIPDGCANCRGVVTIDSKTGAITRNVEYYVLGHASRFVRPGAQRIESTTDISGLESVAFQNSDNDSMALIVLNNAKGKRRFLGALGRPGHQLHITGRCGRHLHLASVAPVANRVTRRQRITSARRSRGAMRNRTIDQ